MSLAQLLDRHHESIHAALDRASRTALDLHDVEWALRQHLALLELLVQEVRRRARDPVAVRHEPRVRVLRDALREARAARTGSEAARAVATLHWLVRELRGFEESVLLPSVESSFARDELDHLTLTALVG